VMWVPHDKSFVIVTLRYFVDNADGIHFIVI